VQNQKINHLKHLALLEKFTDLPIGYNGNSFNLVPRVVNPMKGSNGSKLAFFVKTLNVQGLVSLR